jgi:nucleoside phosphorylase
MQGMCTLDRATGHRSSTRAWPSFGALAVAVLALGSSACGSGDDRGTPQMVAVLSAFPAEGAAVVEQATVTDTTEINGRTFRIGTLGGVPVIMGLTGIGLVNAATTTGALLDRFPVTGVVASAVAGSTVQIGDVVVPNRWQLADGTSYPADPHWLREASKLAASGRVRLAQCTTLPASAPQTGQVCFSELPAILVGGIGVSSDPFNGTADPCTPDAGPVFGPIFGCDVTDAGVAADRRAVESLASAAGNETPIADDEMPIASDMETAAIAGQAMMRGIPFIAFRGVSDGAGDPLGLPPFPAQFYAYYPISAQNAAAVTVAFLERFAR